MHPNVWKEMISFALDYINENIKRSDGEVHTDVCKDLGIDPAELSKQEIRLIDQSYKEGATDSLVAASDYFSQVCHAYNDLVGKHLTEEDDKPKSDMVN